MEFYEVLKTRRSIRSYKSDPVPEEALRRIAEAAQCAPSACNRQPWKLVAVRNAALRKKICEVYRNPFLAQAPVILLALGNASMAWQRPGDDHSIVEIDLGIMFEHAVLAAAAEGLGSCWINRAKEEFESEEGKALLKKWGIEGEWIGVGRRWMPPPEFPPRGPFWRSLRSAMPPRSRIPTSGSRRRKPSKSSTDGAIPMPFQ